MASEDTEITLGAGKLLGLFFLLAAICGVFFAIGYSLGKSSGREQALNDQPAEVMAAAPQPATTNSAAGGKPSAAIAVKSGSNAPTAEEAANSNPQSNLTFYKAVQQNSTGTSAPAKSPEPQSKPAAVETSSVAASSTATSPKEATVHTSTDASRAAAPVTGAGTIVVQIAAVSREDDAVALAGALRKKNYNVFVVNNPITNDKLYHVQVGPFANIKDADAMKAKLVAEGYSPIIKR